MNHVSRDIAPALYVARVFCMLPFSRLRHDHIALKSSVWMRLVTLIVHVFFLVLYIHQIWDTIFFLINTISLTQNVSDVSAAALLFVCQIIDLINTVNLLYLAQQTCKTIEMFLVMMIKVDTCLGNLKSRRNNIYLQVSVVVIFFLIRCFILFYTVINMKLSVKMSPLIASGIYRLAEHLLFVLCLELRHRICIINFQLHTASRCNLSLNKIKNLVSSYQVLNYTQNYLNKKFGLYLLLNISQLFSLTLLGLISLSMPCITGNSTYFANTSTITHCIGYAVLIADGASRFVLQIWGCSVVDSEVSIF
jgi:hypothetical protein